MTDTVRPFDLLDEIKGIVAGPSEKKDRLQAVCQLLQARVAHYDWVGFYIADNVRRELTLGPFAGAPTEHVKIPFGRGICGQAAETEQPFIVQDVAQETNYLACSARVRSEIVLPLFKDGQVVGELDIDSHALAPFTAEDEAFLAEVCRLVADLL